MGIASSQASTLMEAVDLSYAIGDATLVSEVNFSVAHGEFVALLGPNGAGKSTLLKLLCGQIQPSQGKVSFLDLPLSQWPPMKLARHRAVLPQSSAVPFAFTALEIVLLGRSPHGDARTCENLAMQVMTQTDCAHLAERFVTTLSGGEMQRVQLSRVLLQLNHPDGDVPRCLMLDEPISNLDPAHQHRALCVARKFAADGAGVLVVLHDLNLAAQYADRLVIMKRGAIVAEGAPRAVVTEEIVSGIFEVPARVIPNPVCDGPAVFFSVTGEAKD